MTGAEAAAAQLERLVVAQLLGELTAGEAGAQMRATLAERGLGVDADPRIAALFRLAGESAEALSPLRAVVHRLRNRVAGILANVEFVEMVMADPKASLDDRRDLLTALGHARRSCTDLAETLRDVAAPADPRR